MILFTADWHLSSNPRDAYRVQWLNELPALARRLKCSTAIIAGDLTEHKDEHGSWLANTIVNGIHALASQMHVIVYKGNHDYVAEDKPYFEFLRCIDNVEYVNQPTVMNIDTLGKALILPHTRDHVNEWKHLNLKKFDWVLCHNTFIGAISETGHRVDKGIPTDIFADHQSVLAGDVHKPQRVGPVEYVGAPYTVDFGDDYRGRVIVFNDQGMKSVYHDGPQKLLVELTMRDPIQKLDKVETIKGDVVKVRAHITEFKQTDWQKVVDWCRAWAAERKVALYAVQPIVAKAEGKRVLRRDQMARRDDDEVMKAFGRSRGVDDRTMDVGRLIMERVK